MPQIAAKLRSVFALARAGGPVSPDPGRQVSQIAAKLPSHPARLVPAPPAGPSGGPGGLRGSVWSSRLKGNVSFRKSYRYFPMMRRAALPDRPRRPRPAARIGVPPSILAAVDGDAKGRGLEGLCSAHGICGGFCKSAFDSGLECAAAPPSGRKKWLWLWPEACSPPQRGGFPHYFRSGRARSGQPACRNSCSNRCPAWLRNLG